MISPDEADRLIRDNTAPFPSEDCPLSEAHGRILRSAVSADRDLPPFDRVTMDGFALRAAALAEGIRTFQVIGTQAAGMVPLKIGAVANGCVEIMTGAVLPPDADCVVPYEHTTRSGPTVTVDAAAGGFLGGNAIHRRGSDQVAGARILSPGVRLTGREIAVAAACGYSTLTLATRPKIAVVATGDELVDVGMTVAPHQTRRSNDYALRAALVGAGFPRVERFHLRDNQEEIEHKLWHLLAEYDVLVLSGGVSKGKFDFLPGVLAGLGVRELFHGVAQRPGKPLWVGVSARRTLVFALPGNPVATYTCLHRYVLPALAHASGLAPYAPRAVALAASVTFKPKLDYFLPVSLSSGPAAELRATPTASNTSGDFAGLVATDGFVQLHAAQDEFPAGFIAPYFPWF